MAIWKHTTDLTPPDLACLGLGKGQALPSESTIRRVLQNLNPSNLDTRPDQLPRSRPNDPIFCTHATRSTPTAAAAARPGVRVVALSPTTDRFTP